LDDAARLAVRKLVCVLSLLVTSGHSVEGFIWLPALTAEQIRAATNSPEQVQALQDGGFDMRTPLWYYVLAEAKHHGGERLGPVGSTIVAEVLIGLVRRSRNSILRLPGWIPSLPSSTPGHFDLADLLRFAGVRGDAPQARMYRVRTGDSLAKISREQLGDEKRWPEIFALNRNAIRHPARIFPEQLLTLPGATPISPLPLLHVVRPGDTVAKIARELLNDANRWPEIFTLNGAVLTNPDVLVPGQVLLLPS
jgi:nucleoid-associated protein YgaU